MPEWMRSLFHFPQHYEIGILRKRSFERWLFSMTLSSSVAADTAAVYFNPLESRSIYSATSNNMKLVHWPLMGGLLHLVQRGLGGDWAGPQPAQALLAIPNVTAHPSTASVPITVLQYNGPLLCGFNVGIKGLIVYR